MRKKRNRFTVEPGTGLLTGSGRNPISPLDLLGDLGKISTFLHAEVLRAPSTTLHVVASLRLARMFLLPHLPRDAEPSACVLVQDRLPALLNLAFKRASRQLKIGLKERKRKRLEDGSEDLTWARSGLVLVASFALGFDPFPSPFYPGSKRRHRG